MHNIFLIILRKGKMFKNFFNPIFRILFSIVASNAPFFSFPVTGEETVIAHVEPVISRNCMAAVPPLFADGRVAFIEGEKRATILRTTDGGGRWERLSFDGTLLEDWEGKPVVVNATTLFLEKISSGIWQSNDGGFSWRNIFPLHLITSVAFSEPGTGWLQIHKKDGENGSPENYLTQDGGAHWKACSGPQNESVQEAVFINRLVGFGFSSGDFVRPGDREPDRWTKIFQTRNGGCTWEILSFCEAYWPMAFFFKDGKMGWILDTNKIRPNIFLTRDGGKAWRSIPPPPGVPISLFFVDEKTAYFFDYKKNSLYQSLDGGWTWIPILKKKEALKVLSDPKMEKWMEGKFAYMCLLMGGRYSNDCN